MEDEIRAIYRSALDAFHCEKRGYKVLFGPPVRHTPACFIGYQPGDDREYAQRKGVDNYSLKWPCTCEYVHECWPLAKNMRNMFALDFLSRCVGLNAIFVRAKSIQDYRATHSLERRREIQRICRPHVERIVTLLEPHRVVIIGLGTAFLFRSEFQPELRSAGRTLTARGNVAGYPALAVRHLSGRPISTDDRDKIAQAIHRFPSA